MKKAKFLVASSEECADMLYLTGFRAPDPFAALIHKNKTILLLADLEMDRARTESDADEVVSLSMMERMTIPPLSNKQPKYAKALAFFLEMRKIQAVDVPENFPLGLARALKKAGIKTRPVKGPFCPERAIKTEREVRMLRTAAGIAEAGMARGFEVLAASRIRKDGRLWWSGRMLTSERLRIEIEIAVLHAGGQARGDTIVACGEQACDPHARGSGPLRADRLIILDVFPRDAKTGYFGDITRTVVRGRASEAQRKLWQTCLEAQQRALAALKPGADGQAMQQATHDDFAAAGYPTGVHEDRRRGFFHGLGHGLGLEIHEEPRVARANFQEGVVVTIEPGIYWPGVGGVRHEDVALITATGHQLLTSHPKPIEI